MYVALAAVFAVILYFWQGHQVALEFVTGYVLELSLSVDNLFVFLVIFNYFAVPEEQQHRVLVLGSSGRAADARHLHWRRRRPDLAFPLGALRLRRSAGDQRRALLMMGEHQVESGRQSPGEGAAPDHSGDRDYRGGKFFVRNMKDFRIYATPLLVVLVLIETTDVLFAVDSIPAILAITLNAFIVYTSNVFAILGLRSMYFAVSGLMKVFRFLHYGSGPGADSGGREDACGGLLPSADCGHFGQQWPRAADFDRGIGCRSRNN